VPAPIWTRDRLYRAPVGERESALCAIFAELNFAATVGGDDDFFQIGGHSLLATQIASRLRDKLKAPVAVRLLFDHTTIGALAAAIDNLQDEADDDADLL